MPVDNTLYDRLADTWWDQAGLLHALKALNPARVGYMTRILADELQLDPRGRAALDIGCGGGLLAEEFAALGCRVTGADPSARSLEAARAHARARHLEIDYRLGTGEALPAPGASFDIAYCCDVLEHVDDVGRVLAEVSRVLRPGGVFFYETINRTIRSYLVVIMLFQNCSWTSFLPPDLHDWRRFIKPRELTDQMRLAGLAPVAVAGLTPRAGVLAVVRALTARRRGALTYAELVRALDLAESRDTSMFFLGYALKPRVGRR